MESVYPANSRERELIMAMDEDRTQYEDDMERELYGYFQPGDRVTCDLNRGGEYTDSLHDGGEWINKTGTVKSADVYKILIRFDDGDVQRTANERGKRTGFPARNVQPARSA